MDIKTYNKSQPLKYQEICEVLMQEINKILFEDQSKIWHSHPVWFIDGNPIVGYSKQKSGIRLMFWSGQDFKDKKLNVVGKKFKDASIFYNSVEEIDMKKLHEWLKKSKEIQWDYKNIVKRKGKLERIK
jgi:hypothetical protein